MHIHTQRTTGPLQHRHFVAFPLLALVFLGSVTAWRSPIEAELVSLGAEEQQMFAIADGVLGLLSKKSGGKIEEGSFALHEGDILVHSIGRAIVTFRDARMVGWNGGYHVTAQGEVLTVAAITTPVVLKKGTAVALVPLHMQLRFTLDEDFTSIAPSPLPTHYLRDQLKRLQHMDVQESQVSVLPGTSLFSTNTFSFLRLPAAKDRAEEAQEQNLLQELMTALVSGDELKARSLLARADLQEILLHEKSADTTARLLAQRKGKDEVLIAAFLANDEQLLLASAHPALWDVAWLFPLPLSISSSTAALRLLLPPKVDRQEVAISPLALDRWQKDLEEFLATKGASQEFRAAALSALKEYIVWCEEERLPDRASRYSRVLAAIGGNAEISIPAGTPIPAAEVPVETSPSSPVPAVSAIPSVLVSELTVMAQETLLRVGAMLSKATVFAHAAGDYVAVEGVIIASNRGDLRFDFELNPITGDVRAVRFDHRAYPLALPIDAFMAWARKGEL